MIISRSFYLCFLAIVIVSPSLRSVAGDDPTGDQGVFRSTQTKQALEYSFSAEENRLLDEVQRGCFNFFWNEVGSTTKFVKDRREAVVSSVAGIGFQLASLPIAVERKWIDRDAAANRAVHILRLLRDYAGIRHEGVHAHFIHAETADLYPKFKNEASTVDHALLLAGAMPAASYFGGEVADLVDTMAAQTNWKHFVVPESGYLSMGWWPDDNLTMNGPGKIIPSQWHLSSDEERIIYFLAAGGPSEASSLPPENYYHLRRTMSSDENGPKFVLANDGLPFMYFFSHCFIDYRRFGADNPQAFGISGPKVDWFENSSRALHTHRNRCMAMASQFKSFGDNRWGVNPCMAFDEKGKPSYIVPAAPPNLSGTQNWHQGTIATYAAASSIMFLPKECMAALREFKQLDNKGSPLVWRDPNSGSYAFAESFNLDTGLVSDDNVSIDVGPMMLAIENARTGLIWNLFMKHPIAQRAVERLKLK